MRISEINVTLMRKLLLFGGTYTDNINSTLDELKDAQVLEWKSKLKKQHAELLVSIEDLSSVLRSFHSTYPQFFSDKFLQVLLPELEDRSRILQHNLAEFLVWLEALVTPDPTASKFIKPLSPECLALKLSQSLNRSEESTSQRFTEWLACFDDLNDSLNQEFNLLVNKINSIDLIPVGEQKVPEGFKKILSCNGKLVFLHETLSQILIVSEISEISEIVSLPSPYSSHYKLNNQLIIKIEGSEEELVIDPNSPQKYHLNKSEKQIFWLQRESTKLVIGNQGDAN